MKSLCGWLVGEVVWLVNDHDIEIDTINDHDFETTQQPDFQGVYGL